MRGLPQITDAYEGWYSRQYQKTYWTPVLLAREAINRAKKVARRKEHQKRQNVAAAMARPRTIAQRKTPLGKLDVIRDLTRMAIDGIVAISNVRRFAGNGIGRRLGLPTARYYAKGYFPATASGWPLADVVEAVNTSYVARRFTSRPSTILSWTGIYPEPD
jgi:hypothetical protein